ncbi:MAG TPA: hypothetical protein VF524_08235, partial [Polyangia bacterium]
MVLYLRQEGRGIDLLNKIRAYSLQDSGLDTVEANLALGFRDDERDYAIAAHMLKSLDVRSVRVMTNNPNKLEQLKVGGVNATWRATRNSMGKLMRAAEMAADTRTRTVRIRRRPANWAFCKGPSQGPFSKLTRWSSRRVRRSSS